MPEIVGLAGIALLSILIYMVSSMLANSTAVWLRSWLKPVVTARPERLPTGIFSRAWHWLKSDSILDFSQTLVTKALTAPFVRMLQNIEQNVVAAVSHYALSQTGQFTRLMQGLETIATQTALHIKGLAAATYDALDILVTHTIPDIARDVVAPVKAIALQAESLATEAEQRLTDFRNALLGALAAAGIGVFHTLADGINAFVKAFDNLHTEVWQHIRPIVLNLQTVVIPGILGGLGDLEKEIFEGIPGTLGALRQWVQELEDFARNALRDPTAWILGLLGSAAGILGLTAILAKIAPDLFCKNTQNVTKKLCGLDSALLESILGLALAFLVVIDPVAIAEAALTTEDAMDSIIRQTAS